jgi:hypothetical protein
VLAGISYADVQPVVTAFSEPNLLGTTADYGAGRWARPMGDNNVASLVVPQPLTGRACSDLTSAGTGAGTCRSNTRTSFDLGSGLADAVSFLEVSPALLGTFPLTVNFAATSGPGSVESTPLNLACSGTCSANFAARNEVFLKGNSPGFQANWTGCDRVTSGTCVVNMMSAKSVSVKFTALPDPCYKDCYKDCVAEGQYKPNVCSQLCHAECD